MLSHNVSETAVFALTKRQIDEFKYENVFHSIFKKDTWLQRIAGTGYTPTLFGYDLHKLYYYKTGSENFRRSIPCYLVITIAPNIRFLEPDEYELFFECLLPHTRNGDEVTIWKGDDNPMIILNINDLWKADKRKGQEIIVPFLPWLFSRGLTHLQSAYMLWGDDTKTIRTIETDRIIGVGTYKNHASVSSVCWLWLQDTWDEGEKWLVMFQVPGEYHVDAKGSDGIFNETIYTHLEYRP